MKKTGEQLLAEGIWPGKEELVIGEVDQETGVITKEYRIKAGERIPKEAVELYRQSLARGKEAIEIRRHGGAPYSRDQVRAAVGKDVGH